MKPVVIFRHAKFEGAGYLGSFLDTQGIPWQLIKVDEGDAIPESSSEYSGMVLMGGPMSVNDDLPWIPPVLDLIRKAVAADVPLLGHCLGGQLISKALGGVVTQNAVKEIGWGEVSVSDNPGAHHWFGDMESFNGFHWHGETFSLPEGATHLLASQYCQNQAYAIGKHLAFQCHIEMTPEMVEAWCEVGADEIKHSSASPAVQSAEVIMENLPLHCFFLNKAASQVYTQWIKGLVN
jgi:GMP synthase-like glutamine amidotransferase